MSRNWGRLLIAVSVVLFAVAAVGWWRAASGDAELEEAGSEASVQRNNLSDLTDKFEQTRADLLLTEGRLRASRERLRNAQADGRAMQDCVGIVADEDQTGLQVVVFGFVEVEVEGGRRLVVDEAEWFVGDEANREAFEDGEIDRGDSVPNDYYIRNDDRSRVSLVVAQDVIVVTTTADRHNIPAPKCRRWGQFTAALETPEAWEESLERSPYWLTVRGGEVVRILEQYLP